MRPSQSLQALDGVLVRAAEHRQNLAVEAVIGELVSASHLPPVPRMPLN